ncbi:MAG: hypothetical protein KDC44_10400 [Phaeodactylibacter sp.]|nr:hypothetical protein [Phaeodactylibacter sp.]
MKIAVLGTGMVGQIIATKLLELGHLVWMGTRNVAETQSRTKPNQMTGHSFADWYQVYPQVHLETYGALPADLDLFVNATSGGGAAAALSLVGTDKLSGKTVLDLSNPLDFSKGFPPFLSVCNTDSLVEQLQAQFPEVHFVKSLNTMTATLMVAPENVPGDHTVFMSGNDAEAKAKVKTLLQEIGWKPANILDLGDLSTARGTEMLLPIWLRVMGALGHPNFNFHIVQA